MILIDLEGREFDVINDKGKIDLKQLFNIELGEGGQGYDNLQFHYDKECFDVDDPRRAIFEKEDVEDGGGILYEANGDDYLTFTADEIKNGYAEDIDIAGWGFIIVDDEIENPEFKEQVLRERYESSIDFEEIEFEEFVRDTSESDPDFFRWLFGESGFDIKDFGSNITSTMQENFEEFLSDLYYED